MHFRHISAKIQLKNLKQHFDWGDPGWLHPCTNQGNDFCIAVLILTFCCKIFNEAHPFC